jgi:hypothetical protein
MQLLEELIESGGIPLSSGAPRRDLEPS